MDFELPWSAGPSSSPVVLMTATSPQSCPGTQWQSLGNKLTILQRQDNTMQPLPFRLHLLNVDLKNIKYYWQFWHSFVYSQLLKLFQLYHSFNTTFNCFTEVSLFIIWIIYSLPRICSTDLKMVRRTLREMKSLCSHIKHQQFSVQTIIQKLRLKVKSYAIKVSGASYFQRKDLAPALRPS